MNNPVRTLIFRFSDEGGDDRRLRCLNDRKVIMSKTEAKIKARISRSGMKPYECRSGFWHIGHKNPAKQRGVTGN